MDKYIYIYLLPLKNKTKQPWLVFPVVRASARTQKDLRFNSWSRVRHIWVAGSIPAPFHSLLKYIYTLGWELTKNKNQIKQFKIWCLKFKCSISRVSPVINKSTKENFLKIWFKILRHRSHWSVSLKRTSFWIFTQNKFCTVSNAY